MRSGTAVVRRRVSLYPAAASIVNDYYVRMKKILCFQLLLFPALFLFWYYWAPDYLWWVESKAFFVATPDYFTINFPLPGRIGEVAANYLAQFYKSRVYGALLQAGFAMVVLGAADVVAYRIFREKKALWLAFIPVCLFWMFQPGRMALTYAVYWCFWSLAAALAVSLIPRLRLPAGKAARRFCFRSPAVVYLLPLLLLVGAFYFIVTKKEYNEQNLFCRLEHWAELRQWERIDRALPPGQTGIGSDARLLRYALLAVSEKQQLPDRLFQYPVGAPDCFFFERIDVAFCRDFNSVFFSCLGIMNEAIHQAFQGAILEKPGMTFLNFRRMIDWNIRIGNYRAARKYLDILARSSYHMNWVKNRRERLADLSVRHPETDGADDEEKAFFVGVHPFLSDMARVVDRNPENQRAVHYLLCGILITKNLNQFAQVFSICYPHFSSQRIPRHYEEALAMYSQKDPQVLARYPVSKERIGEFNDFCRLLQGGKMYEGLLQTRYGNTFWYYFNFRNAGGK